MVEESKRALGLAWGVAFLGLIYAELNPPATQNALTSVIDAATEDGPAAAFGFLTGATVMHFYNNAGSDEEFDRSRTRILMLAAFSLVSGIVLSSIQVAIVPISATIGIVAMVMLLLARLNSLGLISLLCVLTALSAFVHSVFVMEFPVGGPYPILAWLAYGVSGILIYRAMFIRMVNPYLLFLCGVLVGLIGFLTVLPNYLPALFGISTDMGMYYRENPPTASIRYLSSVAHSGGLMNVVGNFAVGTYLMTASLILQRFRILDPVIATGRATFSTYPFYVLVSAIAMGGFPGFSSELSSAIESPSPTVHERSLDWETFSTWVDDSNSWEELSVHEDLYYGSSDTKLINEDKAQGLEHSSFWWSYPLVAISTLLLSTLWLRRYPDGLIEMWLFRIRRKRS